MENNMDASLRISAEDVRNFNTNICSDLGDEGDNHSSAVFGDAFVGAGTDDVDAGTDAAAAAMDADSESGSGVSEAADTAIEAADEEHRAILRRMRASMAVDMLLDAFGARDNEVVKRLLDFSPDALSVDADGVPDTRALRKKLVSLKRDCGYLFRDGMTSAFLSSDSAASGAASVEGASNLEDASDTEKGGIPHGRGTASGVFVRPAWEADFDKLSDAEYYRRKRMRTR